VSNESDTNIRFVAWGIASAVLGGILHFGYQTQSAGWMLGVLLLAIAAAALSIGLLTARNLRRLNRELMEEEADVAMQTVPVAADHEKAPADSAD
jgi:hypothetical protein